MANTIVLPEGALAAENEIDKAAVGKIRGLGPIWLPFHKKHCINCRME